MYYTIDKAALHSRIEEEVSHAADQAYSDNGQSLYDSVVITEKDYDLVDRFIEDAISAIERRAFDICKPYTSTDTKGVKTRQLYFYVPDFDETMEPEVEKELTECLVMFPCASLFSTRRASIAPQYGERAQLAMDKAVHLLKSRKSPIDIW